MKSIIFLFANMMVLGSFQLKDFFKSENTKTFSPHGNVSRKSMVNKSKRSRKWFSFLLPERFLVFEFSLKWDDTTLQPKTNFWILMMFSWICTAASWLWKLEVNSFKIRKELRLHWQPRCHLCSSKFSGGTPSRCSRQRLCIWCTFAGDYEWETSILQGQGLLGWMGKKPSENWIFVKLPTKVILKGLIVGSEKLEFRPNMPKKWIRFCCRLGTILTYQKQCHMWWILSWNISDMMTLKSYVRWWIFAFIPNPPSGHPCKNCAPCWRPKLTHPYLPSLRHLLWRGLSLHFHRDWVMKPNTL